MVLAPKFWWRSVSARFDCSPTARGKSWGSTGTGSRSSSRFRFDARDTLQPVRRPEFLVAQGGFGLANRPSMSLAAPQSSAVDGSTFRIGIAAARFNGELVDGLLERVIAALRASGVREVNITIMRVPGSHEVPWAAQTLAIGSQCDCVIGLGVLIGGDTSHHELVGTSVSHALQHVALAKNIPV